MGAAEVERSVVSIDSKQPTGKANAMDRQKEITFYT